MQGVGGKMLKTCPGCNTKKPILLFCKNKRNKDGFSGWCKECDTKAKKVSTKKNRDREAIIIPEFKPCHLCGVEKPANGFVKNTAHKDGLSSYCRECERDRQKTRQKRLRARENVLVPDFKPCLGCKTEKRSSEFNRDRGAEDGLSTYCKRCHSVRNRMAKYGVTDEWYQAVLAAQSGGCSICKAKKPGGRGSWHVDHDHSTGKNRGLLCHSCNLLLGHAKDSTEILQNAIDYLNK